MQFYGVTKRDTSRTAVYESEIDWWEIVWQLQVVLSKDGGGGGVPANLHVIKHFLVFSSAYFIGSVVSAYK